MTTDITEKGLEILIFHHLTGTDGLAVATSMVGEAPASCGGTGYHAVRPQDYDRDLREKLFEFGRAPCTLRWTTAP